MKPILCVTLQFLCAVAGAQVSFYCADLPQQVGDYSRAYYSTNVNVAQLLGQSGGPQRWDFSQPQQLNETVRRTDIVSPDEPVPGVFPRASYAERDTDEPASPIAWRYYSMTNQGRLYYGFNNPISDPASPVVVFDQPTLDLPCPVQFGQSWTRPVTWSDTVLSFPVVYDFTAYAQVDAYGTVVLPGLGEIAALRVKELHDYQASYYFFGTWVPFVSQTNISYYWLTPQVGVAAQAILFGPDAFNPTPLPHTNLFLRVFESSAITNPPAATPVAGLRIRADAGQVAVDWTPETNSSHYRVEGIPLLDSTNWQVLGLPPTNFWNETLISTQRFYRVFAVP
jgi:hypothetical protein